MFYFIILILLILYSNFLQNLLINYIFNYFDSEQNDERIKFPMICFFSVCVQHIVEIVLQFKPLEVVLDDKVNILGAI